MFSASGSATTCAAAIATLLLSGPEGRWKAFAGPSW